MCCICICWSNPCDAICITGFWIFLHQGAMRGRLGEVRLIWGGRPGPNTWSFNKGDRKAKQNKQVRIVQYNWKPKTSNAYIRIYKCKYISRYELILILTNMGHSLGHTCPRLFRIQAILVVISSMINIHVIIMFYSELARQSGVGGDKVIWSSRSQQIYLIARLELLEQKLS